MTPSEFNAWRVFPRVAFALMLAACWYVLDWVASLDELSNAQAGFAGTIWATAAAWFKFYVESGNADDPD